MYHPDAYSDDDNSDFLGSFFFNQKHVLPHYRPDFFATAGLRV